MSIENPTLAHFSHFSHFRHFSSLYSPLHLSRILYKSPLFMQNKPNFQKSQMNVSIYLQKVYENKSNWTLGQNKPNSKPISVRPKMSANVYVIEDYENETALRPKKTNPIQTQSNPVLSAV